MIKQGWIWAALAALAIAVGCGDDTGARNVTEADVKMGVDNRIKEVEDNPNLTAEQKKAMIETIKGNIPGRDSATEQR